MSQPYTLIGIFSAALGRRVVESLEAGGIPFELELDNPLPAMTDFRRLGSEVSVFVREENFGAANQILSQQGLKEGRDFFLLTATGK